MGARRPALHHAGPHLRRGAASAPRFVEWRRLWSHKIDCRVCREADATALPSALWSPGWVLQRLDLLHSNGLCGDDPARRLLLREQIDGWLARGTPGFPAYTLGL